MMPDHPNLASPQRCRHFGTRLFRGETDQVLASTATPPPAFMDHTTLNMPDELALCLPSPTLEPSLQARDPGSLFESISSLRLALESASASALSLSVDLVASMDDLRATTAALAASVSSAAQATQASVSDATLPSPSSAHCENARDEAMRKGISVPAVVIGIVITAIGTCMLSLLGYFLYTHRHRVKQRAHLEEKAVNAALDRAIVSYIAKEAPGPRRSSTPDDPRRPKLAMTTGVNANMNSREDDEHMVSGPHYEPPIPPMDQRQPLQRTETSATNTSKSWRRTASSHFMDSAERVYANILASPLEHTGTRPSLTPEEPASADRDDVGWPFPSKENWL